MFSPLAADRCYVGTKPAPANIASEPFQLPSSFRQSFGCRASPPAAGRVSPIGFIDDVAETFSTPLCSGHHQIGNVAPAMGANEPLRPIGNARLRAV
jgi:hypothetical protein